MCVVWPCVPIVYGGFGVTVVLRGVLPLVRRRNVTAQGFC
jgi:hypothetical protein